MKANLVSLTCFLLVSSMLSCQEGKKEVTAVKPNKEAGARRACNNSIGYRFVYPDNDYTYGGTGCISYFVHRGQTRQVKVVISNAVGYSQNVQLQIRHPNDTNYFSYSVGALTGGTTSIVTVGNGAAIVWTANDMPAFTTYELTLNIGGVMGSSSAENRVRLILDSPCTVPENTDCDADENLHLVLTD